MPNRQIQQPPPSPSAPGSLEALRERNRRTVIDALRRGGTISRAEIARRTGLSRSTVSSVVTDLMGSGLVREIERTSGASSALGGRPATPLVLDASAGAALGISLNYRRLRVAICDFGHAILAERSADLCDPNDSRAVRDLVVAEVAAAIDAAGVDAAAISGAVMTVPGPVEMATGRVGQASIVPGLVGPHFARELSEVVGFDIHLENDANLSVLAEMLWGAGDRHQDVIFIKLSRGIGAGLVLGGQLFRGALGTAGEVGHTPVVSDGTLCRCGNRGCLETVVGTDAIVQMIEGQIGERITIDTVIRRALGGDPTCRRALRDAGIRLGTAVAQICNLLNPELIVIGGDLAPAWPVMSEPLRHALDGAAIHMATDSVRIIPSPLGERAEVLGALAYVLRDADRFTMATP